MRHKITIDAITTDRARHSETVFVEAETGDEAAKLGREEFENSEFHAKNERRIALISVVGVEPAPEGNDVEEHRDPVNPNTIIEDADRSDVAEPNDPEVNPPKRRGPGRRRDPAPEPSLPVEPLETTYDGPHDGE